MFPNPAETSSHHTACNRAAGCIQITFIYLVFFKNSCMTVEWIRIDFNFRQRFWIQLRQKMGSDPFFSRKSALDGLTVRKSIAFSKLKDSRFDLCVSYPYLCFDVWWRAEFTLSRWSKCRKTGRLIYFIYKFNSGILCKISPKINSECHSLL